MVTAGTPFTDVVGVRWAAAVGVVVIVTELAVPLWVGVEELLLKCAGPAERAVPIVAPRKP